MPCRTPICSTRPYRPWRGYTQLSQAGPAGTTCPPNTGWPHPQGVASTCRGTPRATSKPISQRKNPSFDWRWFFWSEDQGTLPWACGRHPCFIGIIILCWGIPLPYLLQVRVMNGLRKCGQPRLQKEPFFLRLPKTLLPNNPNLLLKTLTAYQYVC